MKTLKQPTETEKILANKNLMQKIRKARKDGSPSSPYNPLSIKTLKQPVGSLRGQLQEKAIRFADLVIETNKKYGHSWNIVAAKMENQLWIKVEDAEKVELKNRKEWLEQKRHQTWTRYQHELLDELLEELNAN